MQSRMQYTINTHIHTFTYILIYSIDESLIDWVTIAKSPQNCILKGITRIQVKANKTEQGRKKNHGAHHAIRKAMRRSVFAISSSFCASTIKNARLHRVYLCMSVCIISCVHADGGCICVSGGGGAECASCPNRSIYQMGALSLSLLYSSPLPPIFQSRVSGDFYFPSFPFQSFQLLFFTIATYDTHIPFSHGYNCVCSMSERQYMPWVALETLRDTVESHPGISFPSVENNEKIWN